jgi:hypothetical protein
MLFRIPTPEQHCYISFMNPQLTAEGASKVTWLAIVVGIPCLLLIVGAFVGVAVMLVRRK